MISKPFEEWSKGGSKDLSSRHQRKRDCEGQRPFTWGAGELAGSKSHVPHYSPLSHAFGVRQEKRGGTPTLLAGVPPLVLDLTTEGMVETTAITT